MDVKPEFTFFPGPRPAVMVVSHERSGTHFLMNALAACYGYVSLPWINLDRPTEIRHNQFPAGEIRDTLLMMADRPMANIVKAHHAADFFDSVLEAVTQRFAVFVIHRDPVDVMVSFWRHLHRFLPSDYAGPLEADPVTFARAVPFGRMIRYQTRPFASIIKRWAAHVEGWRRAAETCPRVHLVRYEDLDTRYEETVQSFATILEATPQSLSRPARDYNVIPRGPDDPMGTGRAPDLESLRKLCREAVPDIMARLGY